MVVLCVVLSDTKRLNTSVGFLNPIKQGLNTINKDFQRFLV